MSVIEKCEGVAGAVRNHYIPQFIIRQFADPEGFVYVYDKKAKKIRRLKPKDVFVLHNLYDDDVERLLATVESRISRTLTSVLASCRNLTKPEAPEADILGCCRYFAMLQLGRTRFAKDIGVEAVGCGWTDAELEERLVESGFGAEDLDCAKQAQAEELGKLEGRGKASGVYRRLMLKLIGNPAEVYPDVAKAVVGKGVVFASSDSAFVLGDRGAVSTGRAGRPLGHPLSEVYFPVSPDIALSIQGAKDRLSFVRVGRETTRSANLSTMAHNHWIVSHSARLLRSLARPR